jgi:hypothetical protein
LVFSIEYLNFYCEKCGNKYEENTNTVFRMHKCANNKWCQLCRVTYLENNFKNWTSGNEKIDDFIQKKQLKSIIFEWIPYNRLVNIKEIRKGDFSTAIWEDGPLYCHNGWKLKRISYEKVFLKYLYSSQNINNEFLNKV